MDVNLRKSLSIVFGCIGRCRILAFSRPVVFHVLLSSFRAAKSQIFTAGQVQAPHGAIPVCPCHSHPCRSRPRHPSLPSFAAQILVTMVISPFGTGPA